MAMRISTITMAAIGLGWAVLAGLLVGPGPWCRLAARRILSGGIRRRDPRPAGPPYRCPGAVCQWGAGPPRRRAARLGVGVASGGGC